MTQTDIKNTLFEKGKAAMIFGGDWLAGVFDKVPYTKKRADVAVLPAGVKRATVIHGLGNVISAGTAHPDEAWEFLQFLGSRQAALILAETGTVIPAYNDTQNHWVRSIPQYHLSNMIAELPYAVPYPVSQDTAEWNALEHTYFSRAWAGKMSIVTAARTVARKMNAILLREREH
jgi:multiple sugar transport system substrate-binding protein